MKSDASLPAHEGGRERKTSLPVPSTEDLPSLQCLKNLPGMVFLARADHERTVESASAGSVALLGIPPTHQPFGLAPLMHADDREQVLEVIKSAVAHNQSFAVEFRVRHADGRWLTVWEQGQPIQLGRVHGVQSYLIDVTQRVQREQERAMADLRMMQAQKFNALNLLAGGVAHEFNNLIAGILGSAELVAMDLPDKHPAQETLRQIFEASNQARDFVYKLRTFAQRPAPEFKPIRLQPVVEECLQILRNIIPDKVELHPCLNPDCPKINGDGAQLQQAILDLCLHAWHGLADRRGCIHLTLDCMGSAPLLPEPSNTLRAGPYVCLTVQDTSHGLEKSARDLIFHPFRNRRSTGKKVGLELFQVRETVQAHHGEIVAESQPGHGVIFRVYLPIATEAP